MSARPVIRIIVSIDTEEDNWIAARSGITTQNVDQLPALDRRFEALGVRATYFTNYQVAIQPASAAIIQAIHGNGRSEIGAHLHPWNTPPESSDTGTMLLNLPPEAQAAKIVTVTRALTELLGASPRSFRAGRFGLGSSTVQALIAAGYAIDSSITPFMSWENEDGGPSHVGAPLHLYRLGGGDQDVRIPGSGPLIEAPLSSGYNRWPPSAWPRLQAVLTGRMGSRLFLSGIAARLGLAQPVILSPEAHGAATMLELSRRLVEGGVPFLHVFWHSPSMTPGLSPFCRSSADVARLLARFERLLERLDRHVSMRFVTISEAVAEVGVPDLAAVTAPPPQRPVPVVTAAAGDAAPVAPAGDSATPDAPGEEPASDSRLGRHTAIYLAGILFGRAVGFVMLPFYTHYLTPADYGILQLLEMTLDIISIVAGSRIASGIHRYYFKARNEADRKAVLSTALVLLAVSFLIFGAATGILAVPLTTMVLGSAEHADLTRIAAMSFGFQGLIIVPLAIIQLWKRSLLLTAANTVKLLIQLTLNIVLLAAAGLGVKGLFVSTMVANMLMGAALVVYIVRQTGLRFHGPAARSLIRYGLPLVVTQFATFFITYGDRYFLRVSADVAQVGLYSLAYQFGFIVASVGYVPFSLIWEPTRFQLAHRPDRDELYSRAFIFMNVIQWIATVGCVFYVRDFIYVMAAPPFHSAYLIVPVVLMAYVLQSWAYFHEIGTLVRERTGLVTLANWIGALVALAGYVVLIPRWLGWGAAWATVLAFLVRWIMIYVMAQRVMPIRYDWMPVWRLSALSMAFVAVAVVVPHPSLVASLVMRTALFGAYLWLIWHIGVIRPGEKARMLVLVRSPRNALQSLLGSRTALVDDG